MSYVHSLIGSGGIKEAFAVIHVTYPSGSTCTCTKDTKVLSASDTSGEFVFLIPEAGTWTVKSFDGQTWETSQHKVSKHIIIDHQYQTENISLSYMYPILQNGILNSDLEFVSVNRSSLSAGKITATSDGMNGNYWYINPKIDFTSYNTISIHLKAPSVSSAFALMIGLTDTAISNSGYANLKPLFNSACLTISSNISSYENRSIDISNITGMHYLSSISVATYEIDEILLEG